MKFLILFFFSLQVFSETRDEARTRELNEAHGFNENLNDKMKRQNAARADLLTSGPKLGYTTFNPRENKKPLSAETIVSEVISSSTTIDAILVLRLYCTGPQYLVPINAAFKDIIWEVGKKLLGSVSSDRQGFVKISFSFKSDQSYQTLNLTVGGEVTKVNLLSGPYEIFLNEKSCQ